MLERQLKNTFLRIFVSAETPRLIRCIDRK